MRKKINIFALCSLLIALNSCKPKEVIRYVNIPVRHDSIIERTVKDTVIHYAEQKQQVVTVRKSHLETDLALSDALIDSAGLLHHSIANKQLIPAKIKIEKVTVRDSVNVPYPVKGDPYPVIEVKKVNVYGFFWWSGMVFWLWILIFLVVKINEKYQLFSKIFKR